MRKSKGGYLLKIAESLGEVCDVLDAAKARLMTASSGQKRRVDRYKSRGKFRLDVRIL